MAKRAKVLKRDRKQWRVKAYDAGRRYARRYKPEVVTSSVTFRSLASTFLTYEENTVRLGMGHDTFWLYFTEGARDELAAMRGA